MVVSRVRSESGGRVPAGETGGHFFFGGGAGFAGAGFASFFGFFFSRPCELFPFAMIQFPSC